MSKALISTSQNSFFWFSFSTVQGCPSTWSALLLVSFWVRSWAQPPLQADLIQVHGWQNLFPLSNAGGWSFLFAYTAVFVSGFDVSVYIESCLSRVWIFALLRLSTWSPLSATTGFWFWDLNMEGFERFPRFQSLDTSRCFVEFHRSQPGTPDWRHAFWSLLLLGRAQCCIK